MGYKEKKQFFNKVIAIYGQNAVSMALGNQELNCRKLHVARSKENKPKIRELLKLAEQRGLPIKRHKMDTLSRLSRNSRQDQGIVLDVVCPNFQTIDDHVIASDQKLNIIALDGITNPRNIGMIIRSAVASEIDGIIYPEFNSPHIGPLVVQASAGTVFNAPILRCRTIEEALIKYVAKNFEIIILDVKSKNSIFDLELSKKNIFLLGGETCGVSAGTKLFASKTVSIPMSKTVDSLNVAVAAGVLSYFIRFNLGYN